MTDLKLNIKKVQAVPLDEYYTAYQLQQLINFYKTITPENDKVGVSFIKELEKHSESFIKKLEKDRETQKKEGKNLSEQIDACNTIIERFLVASGNSKDITDADDFERIFEDIEQTYSEYEELRKENVNLDRENEILYKALKEIEGIVSEPCNIAEKTCKECKSNCEHKDILNIIKMAEEQ